MNNQLRQNFLVASFFVIVSCLAMFQIMKLGDRISLLEQIQISGLLKLEHSVVKLGDSVKSHETKHHSSGEDQASPAASSAVSSGVQTDELKKTESKLLKMIEGLRETLIEYTTSDIQFELRKYWTYYPQTVELLKTLDENDPRLVEHIKTNLLITPAPQWLPYLFSNNKSDFSEGQVDHIRKIFKNMRNGFFVECGGADGEFYSNTIPLERELGWQGALIEADPVSFNKLLGRKRKVWTVPTCLSLKNKPTMVSFDKRMFAIGKIDFEKKQNETFSKTMANRLNVFCMPFAAIMKALDKKVIDVFSLDVEGHEFAILQTIPWDKLDIKVLMVEHFQNSGEKEAMKKYMLEKGYKTYGEELTNEKWTRENYMFVKISSNLIEDLIY